MRTKLSTLSAAIGAALALSVSALAPVPPSASAVAATGKLVVTEKDDSSEPNVAARPTRIDAATPLVIVFDTSGSMSDTDASGAVKMDTAKRVMNDLLADGRMKSALWTYPGGAEIDGCYPGGWVPGSAWSDDVNATKVSADIRQLVPDGDTPTGPALLRAAEAIGKGTDAEIILVSDGESNCGPPPCEVAQQLVNEGYRIRVQPIGFDLGDQPDNELQCVADTTGGTYRKAEDSEQLRDFIAQMQVEPLSLDINVPTKIPKSNTLTVSATVRNELPERSIPGARVNLTFNDPDGVVTQRYVPLQQAVPLLQPGEERTVRWQLSLEDKPGIVSWAITAGASGVSAQIAQGELEVTNEALGANDAGEILKNITGNVVVIGDSFSAGEGTSAPDGYDEVSGIPYACHRSTENLYASHIFNEDAKIHNLACSGASTEAVGAGQWADGTGVKRVAERDGAGVSSQLDQLAAIDDPQAIFLTLGGSDIGLNDVVHDCLAPNRSCDLAALKADNYEGSATWHAYTLLSALFYEPAEDAAVRKQRRDRFQQAGLLPQVYAEIDARVNAPRRENDQAPIPIFVSAYPYPLHVPQAGACGENISDGEVRQMWDLSKRLNQTIGDAVSYSRSEMNLPVHFVNTVETMALPGHSVCSSDEDSYFVTPAQAASRTPEASSSAANGAPELFHPTVGGHKKWATEITIWSQGYNEQAAGEVKAASQSGVKRFFNKPIHLFSSDITTKATTLSDSAPQVDNDAHQYVANGESITITVDDVQPGDTVRFYLDSSLRRLGSTQVEEGEHVAALGTVLPASLNSGKHMIEAWIDCADGSQKAVQIPITVYSAPPLWLLLVSGIALIGGIASAILWVISARKLRQAKAS